MEEKNLEEFIPEYGITLREYRLRIYNAEKGNDYPISQFLEKLNFATDCGEIVL